MTESGRQPKLPIDLAFGLVKDKDRKPQTKYIHELKNRLVDAYKLASESAKKAHEKQKEHYDLKVRGAVVEKGDKVLVKKVALDGKHKLSDKWENDIYLVLKQPNKDIPVYVVQKDSGGSVSEHYIGIFYCLWDIFQVNHQRQNHYLTQFLDREQDCKRITTRTTRTQTVPWRKPIAIVMIMRYLYINDQWLTTLHPVLMMMKQRVLMVTKK
ncbi:Hypothetical predicted protein, partial [Mytilus galloprovincialis]